MRWLLLSPLLGPGLAPEGKLPLLLLLLRLLLGPLLLAPRPLLGPLLPALKLLLGPLFPPLKSRSRWPGGRTW